MSTRSSEYDAARDFDPIALLARVGFVLVTRSGCPRKTSRNLFALAKASPGTITMGSYGIGSTSHLALAALKEKTGASFLHVPYRGVAPAINAILTGEIDAAFVSPNTVIGMEKNGQAKILARRPCNACPSPPTFQPSPNRVSRISSTETGTASWRLGGCLPRSESVWKTKYRRSRCPTLSCSVRRRRASLWNTSNSSRFSDFMRQENDRWGKTVAAQKIEVVQ